MNATVSAFGAATPATNRVLLDPTSEHRPVERRLTERSASLQGITVALLDITKPRGDVFLQRIEEQLHLRGIATRRYAKATFTKPASVDLRHEIARDCQAVIEALAD